MKYKKLKSAMTDRKGTRRMRNVFMVCTKHKTTGKIVKSKETTFDSSVEETKKSFWCSKRAKFIGIPLILLVVLAIITTVVILIVETNTCPNEENLDDDYTLKPPEPGLTFEKEEWGGLPAVDFINHLQHPIHFVIISHSATPMCYDFSGCCQRVQSIQTFHLSNNYPDIRYNFLVGGDGNVYVGRGWDFENSQKNDSIGINFIGNFVYDYLTEGMIRTTQKLLEVGVQTQKLALDYKLVAHNHTAATLSPGPHVYEIIKKWPNFDPSIYF